jgi:hypothetical protein
MSLYCVEQGRINRLNIINYLESVDDWATVTSIALAIKSRCKTSVYCHCNNLVRESVLEIDRVLINNRLNYIYRLKRH